MANKGLILNSLKKISDSEYKSSGGCSFYVSEVSDANLKMRIVQAIDLGFSVRNKSQVMGITCSFLEKNAEPSVRIYDDEGKFLFPSPPQFFGVATDGASLWDAPDCLHFLRDRKRSNPSESYETCRLSSSPVRRYRRKTYINPRGGRLVVSDTVFGYRALVNVVWHEFYHLTTQHHHLTDSAPYRKPGDPWPVPMANIASAFPEEARDPVTGETIKLGTSSWTSNKSSIKFG